MALALVAIGVALSRARSRFDDRLSRLGSARLHALPRLTASVVTLAGVVVIVRAVR